MGKEGEVWDDSALIHAFDHAISNYKKVHGKAQLDSSKAGEQETNDTGEDISTRVDENYEVKRQATEDLNNNGVSQSEQDLQETSNELPSKENQQGPNCNSSNVHDDQNAPQGYPNTLSAEDYNQLLIRYYEIEEQRQKILQQLDPYNYWNYQQPGPIATNQPNPSITAPPCDPYVNQCIVAPCYLGGTCTSEPSGIVCNGISTFIEDRNVTKAALPAVEKAIPSSKIKDLEKQAEACVGQLKVSDTAEADFNVVTKAWYDAGFYTGKYLAEHTTTKKHQG